VRGDEEERSAGNAIGWYVAYRIADPFLRAVELGMRARFWWRSRR
jgi:hypothetical protein